MKIFNTLTGKKEELVTLKPEVVNMYVCGPTTYNYIHLGNARPLVVFDTVRRYLAFRGYRVFYVQNFTDVDDKIINRAREEGEDPIALAERYINEYYQDADTLGIIRADIHPRVSEHIPDIVSTILGLVNKGFAYEVDGDVYYRVKKFDHYGRLSKRSLDDMLAGARVEVNDRKEEPVDFALWKKAKPGEPAWASPWGEGRPGWHIECSVMSTKYLGETFDIHGGGADLIFPHHENEIAQAEAYTGRPFVNYWMHNGFITVNSEKMSKSLGNFFILRDILAQYPNDVVRFYLIATHYRSPLDFDDGKLEEARKALGRLKTTLNLGAEFLAVPFNQDNSQLRPEQNKLEEEAANQQALFIEAMDDDFNTAKALGYLFDLSHSINSFVAQGVPGNENDARVLENVLNTFAQLGTVLGIFIDRDREQKHSVDALLDLLLSIRNQARAEKDYQLADLVRDLLNRLEVKVEDKASGSIFRYEVPPGEEGLAVFLVNLYEDLINQKQQMRADQLKEQLTQKGIVLEDTDEGIRWKFV